MTPPDDLLTAAKEAFANAYAPYSGFRVGVALRDPEGVVHRGANVENASYGLSRCGEQSAIQALVTSGARSFDEAVVYTHAHEPASPCGACRQILFEFNPGATVYLVNQAGAVKTFQVRELLPDAFELEGDPGDGGGPVPDRARTSHAKH